MAASRPGERATEVYYESAPPAARHRRAARAPLFFLAGSMISPDAIKNLVERDFADVRAERRYHPDGWSFFHRYDHSARLARAVQPWPGSPTFFRLGVSSRLSGTEQEREAESAEQVRGWMEEELRLYAEHFGRPQA
jgi:hypothetical protein